MASKAIGVIGRSAAIETAIRSFNAAKNKLASLIRGNPSLGKIPVELPSTEDMPPEVANKINEMAENIFKYNCWLWSKIVDLDRRVQYNV